MKLTINQETNDVIYLGEDKVFNFYLYDEETFEFIDLSVYDEIKFSLRNANATIQEFTADITNAATGKVFITVTAAESALLGIERNTMKVDLNDTVGGTSNIELFSNYIDVIDPNA